MAALRRLIHVAVFTWKPGTTHQEIQALRDGLTALPHLVPEIRRFRFGADAGLREGNADFAVVAEFDSAEHYRAYAAHPDHRALIDRLIQPIVDRRTSLQFEATGEGG